MDDLENGLDGGDLKDGESPQERGHSESRHEDLVDDLGLDVDDN